MPKHGSRGRLVWEVVKKRIQHQLCYGPRCVMTPWMRHTTAAIGGGGYGCYELIAYEIPRRM